MKLTYHHGRNARVKFILFSIFILSTFISIYHAYSYLKCFEALGHFSASTSLVFIKAKNEIILINDLLAQRGSLSQPKILFPHRW